MMTEFSILGITFNIRLKKVFVRVIFRRKGIEIIISSV